MSAPAPMASSLAGNWLIVGPMPTIAPGIAPPPERFRLAVTMDAVGDNVVAAGFGNHVCPGFTESFSIGSVLSGAVAKDRTFSLGSSSIFPNMAMTLTGKIPAVGQGQWTGNYNVSFTTPPSGLATCVETLSDTFTATSFPLVSGVYVGTASNGFSLNGVPITTTMSLQVTLQQGGTATDFRGNTVTSNAVLTGSIKVTGSPCFSSGTITGTPSSSVLGNEVHAAFAMDDGSTLEFIGSMTDATESKIATNLVLITGGQCGGSRPPVAYRITELDRQI
ncbi:MAG: hypothetical protein JSS95_17895 [Acidobacteria bacterium]|nr:hypothetical protein [Acidobacteriota bacterium]